MVFFGFDDGDADRVSMALRVVGESQKRRVVLVDVAFAFSDMCRPRFAADFESRRDRAFARSLEYGLDEDLFHPSRRGGSQNLFRRFGVEDDLLARHRINQAVDDSGDDHLAAVVENVVGFEQLHEIDPDTVTVGGDGLVELGVELTDAGHGSPFFIRQVHTRRARQPETKHPFVKLFAVEFLRQLCDADVGGVDDDVFGAEPVEFVFVPDHFTPDLETSAVDVDDVVGIDLAVFEQDGKDERLEDRTGFEAVFKRTGVE